MFLIQNVPPLFLQHFGIFADSTKHKSPFGLVCKEIYKTVGSQTQFAAPTKHIRHSPGCA